MLADAPARLSESTGDQVHDMTSTVVGLSAGCSRALMITASPFQDQDGKEARQTQSRHSSGKYCDSDDEGPGLHASSDESVPGEAGNVSHSNGGDSFTDRCGMWARELETEIARNASRQALRRRLRRPVV